jgi:hypothetical protein
MTKCKWCGKETRHKTYCCEGHNKNMHRRKNYLIRKEKHKCITCGDNIQPIYKVRCEKCLKRNRSKKK